MPVIFAVYFRQQVFVSGNGAHRFKHLGDVQSELLNRIAGTGRNFYQRRRIDIGNVLPVQQPDVSLQTQNRDVRGRRKVAPTLQHVRQYQSCERFARKVRVRAYREQSRILQNAIFQSYVRQHEFVIKLAAAFVIRIHRTRRYSAVSRYRDRVVRFIYGAGSRRKIRKSICPRSVCRGAERAVRADFQNEFPCPGQNARLYRNHIPFGSGVYLRRRRNNRVAACVGCSAVHAHHGPAVRNPGIYQPDVPLYLQGSSDVIKQRQIEFAVFVQQAGIAATFQHHVVQSDVAVGKEHYIVLSFDGRAENLDETERPLEQHGIACGVFGARYIVAVERVPVAVNVARKPDKIIYFGTRTARVFVILPVESRGHLLRHRFQFGKRRALFAEHYVVLKNYRVTLRARGRGPQRLVIGNVYPVRHGADLKRVRNVGVEIIGVLPLRRDLGFSVSDNAKSVSAGYPEYRSVGTGQYQ